MAMRAALWVSTLLAIAASAGAGDPEGTGGLGCGNLSPFVNTCVECCAALGPSPEATANLAGYAGALEMRLEGPQGAWVWQCWTILLDEPLPITEEVCEGPLAEGQPPVPGESVRLVCHARPHAVEGAPLGPAGPWGCRAA